MPTDDNPAVQRPVDVTIVTADLTPYGDFEPDEPILSALRARDVDVAYVQWDDADFDWSSTRLAVVRSTWDYTERRDEFVAWAERAGAATDLRNDAAVLRWNTDKRYLLELEDRGAPIVPTAWLGQGDRVVLDDVLRSRGWTNGAIIKPTIDVGALRLTRVEPGQDAQGALDALLADGDVMVQPYIGEVETLGELSVVFLGGAFSHAVEKIPAAGDFRVQEQYGSTMRAVDAPTEAVDLAAWILAASGHTYLYARVDLLRDDLGSWFLAELEVTEPDLYLHVVPGTADRLADAIVDALHPT